MWLLDVKTRKPVSFLDDRQAAGKYAILSHTWEDDEVTFSDVHYPKARLMRGYAKIEYTCRQAEKDGLLYAWIDTCCINKDSSAELSESINSMFRWYQNSAVCYVYLSDVALESEVDAATPRPEMTSCHTKVQRLSETLRSCRWSTRGWTLQEMIAPQTLHLFDCNWHLIGTLCPSEGDAMTARVLSQITGVDSCLLEKKVSLDEYSVAQRISWASRRATTRVEDVAYSLLGLLGVNMPLLYGEGNRAFLRLQEELLRSTMDRSILLWKPHALKHIHTLFAPDVSCFACDVFDWQNLRGVTHTDNILTNRGLRTTMSCMQLAWSNYIRASPGASHPNEGSPRTTMMLRRISQPEAEHPTSVPSIPAFEVVRAPEFRVRQEELSEAGQSWTLQEVVLLRESQDFIYYLDVDDRLEIKLMDHKGTFRQFEEIRCRSPLQALYVKDLKTHSRHCLELKPRAVTENVTTRWSIDHCNNKSWSIVPTGGEREVLRGVLWTSQYNGLSDMCPLPPSSHVVRIWYSEHNLPGSAIDVQSLPSNPFLEILWNLDTDLGAHCEWDYAKSQHRNVQFIQRHWRKTVLNWIQLFSDKEKTVIDLV